MLVQKLDWQKDDESTESLLEKFSSRKEKTEQDAIGDLAPTSRFRVARESMASTVLWVAEAEVAV